LDKGKEDEKTTKNQKKGEETRKCIPAIQQSDIKRCTCLLLQ